MNFGYQSKTQDGENSEKNTFPTEKKSYGHHNSNRQNRFNNDDNNLNPHYYHQPNRNKEGQPQRNKNQSHGQLGYNNRDYYHQRQGYTNRSGQWNKTNSSMGSTNHEINNNTSDIHQNNNYPRSGGNNRHYNNYKNNSSNQQKNHYHNHAFYHEHHSPAPSEPLKDNDMHVPSTNVNDFHIPSNKEMDSNVSQTAKFTTKHNNVPKSSEGDVSSFNHPSGASDSKEFAITTGDSSSSNPTFTENNKHVTKDFPNDGLATSKTSKHNEDELTQKLSNLQVNPVNNQPQGTLGGSQFTEQTVHDLALSAQASATMVETSPSTSSTSENCASPESSHKSTDINAPTTAHNVQSTSTSVADNPSVNSSTAQNTGSSISVNNISWKGRKARMENSIERQAKALLNKLTIEKFATVIEKLAQLEETIKDEEEMQTFVNLVVSKAALERDWSEMYADLCLVLFWRSPHLKDPKINSFRVALVTKIQNEFLLLPKTLELTDEQKEGLDQASIEAEVAKMKNHINGVVTLIGELYQRKLLAYQILNHIVMELVISMEEPHEHFVECFVQLICTTGYYIDQNPAIKSILDHWFGRLIELKNKNIYSKRLICVIQNALDLRKSNWLKKIHKYTASGLDEIRDQVEHEAAIGGPHLAAEFGHIVTVGKPMNASSNYLYDAYLKEQKAKFLSKRPLSNAPSPPSS